MLLVQDSRKENRARFVLAGAILTVFLTAFEVKTPVFSLGPVGFTTTELAAGFFFITVAAWAMQEGLASFFSRRTLDVAVLLFVVSNFVSVIAADDRPSALKFSLRMTYAALIFVGVSRLPQRLRPHLWIAGTVTVALIIVTLTGLLENYISFIYWPDILKPFQEGIITFGAFYNVRVASTLPFPTTLSMYLELAAPMALALAVWMIGRSKEQRRRQWLTVLAVIGLAAVMAVQVFTFTRSGLVATPVSLLAGALAAAIFGYGRRVWMLFVTGAVLLSVIVVASTAVSSKMASRLDVAEQEKYYGADYTLVSFPEKLTPDSRNTAVFHVKNTGSITWGTEGNETVEVAYRWASYPDRVVHEEVPYITTSMPREVQPGEEVDITLDFMTPVEPGRYVWIFELAKAHVGWFSSAGVAPYIVPLEFQGGEARRFAITDSPDDYLAKDPVTVQATRSQLWKAAFKTWKTNMVLGVGPDQFRRRYQEFAPELPPDQRVRTHNIFMEALTNTGLVGLACMVFLLAATLFAQLRLVRNRRLKPSERYISLALLVATVAYVVHGMLDCFLWQTGIIFLFFTYLGLTSWMCQRADADQ